MKHLTPPQVEQLKKQLQEKLNQLTQFRESVDEANPINDPTRLVDNAELGDEAMEGDQILQNDVLSDQSKAMIADIRAALQRIQEGTYGIDEDTKEPIPFERLRLVPEAHTTVPRQN